MCGFTLHDPDALNRRGFRALGSRQVDADWGSRPVARSHRDWRSAGIRTGVVSAYILNKNPSASSNSVTTDSPCRGTSPRKVLGHVRLEIFDLVHHVNAASKGLVRLVLSSVHCRIIPSLRTDCVGSGSRSLGPLLQSLLKLSPRVPQLSSTIENELPRLR